MPGSRSIALLPAMTMMMLTGGLGDAGGQNTNDLQTRFAARLEQARHELIEIRRDLHRHPEVSGQEVRTAAVVADRLSKLGFEVRTGVGGHGVVGVLRGDLPGPVVAFRADMDAVPSQAPDPVEFRSTVPGVRHICGHDVHTTVGLALAEGLVAVRDHFSGTVMLIFQPAEENVTGARAMLADGVFDDPTPDAIFAYHTAPLNVGEVATAPETLMARRDFVRVTLSGTGDLRTAADNVGTRIRSLSTIAPEQAMQPVAPNFIFVQLGRAAQIDGGAYSVNGSISTASAEDRRRARQQVEDLVASVNGDGVTAELVYQERAVAGVTNEPALVRQASRSAGSVLGEESIIMLDVVSPAFSEDFGSFQEHVPGVMFFLGVSNAEKGWVGMPHTPNYVADEEAIFVGARAMAAVLLDFLQVR